MFHYGSHKATLSGAVLIVTVNCHSKLLNVILLKLKVIIFVFKIEIKDCEDVHNCEADVKLFYKDPNKYCYVFLIDVLHYGSHKVTQSGEVLIVTVNCHSKLLNVVLLKLKVIIFCI